MTTKPTPPVVLLAGAPAPAVTSVLDGARYEVHRVATGALALECAPSLRPDTIILDAELPDMSGLEGCRWLQTDPRIGHNVPILILTPDVPSPEQRVAALRAGAWDFVRPSDDRGDLALRIEILIQAKRNIDVALAEGALEPPSGLQSRAGLARRARELGALMARERRALACVVFELDIEPADPGAGSRVARASRVSDVVGELGPGEFAVLAPATDQAGAVHLARRVAEQLHDRIGDGQQAAVSLRVGYDAVANLGHWPIDPVALLVRATAALRRGTPDPGFPWVRRFDAGPTTDTSGSGTPRVSAPGVASIERSSP